MKKIILILMTLPFIVTSLYAKEITGDFTCKMSFWEVADYEMIEGEDYPRDVIYLRAPRKRNVTVSLSFSKKQIVTANNSSSSFPNFMLLTLKNHKNQRSQYYPETNLYKVSWYDTWYYGSSLKMEVLSQNKKLFVADFFFDDNDGYYIRVKKVTCQRLL